jgi:glycosyltransferase 2 family protein
LCCHGLAALMPIADYGYIVLIIPANFIRQLLICVALSVAFYAAWAAYGGIGEVWSAIRTLGVSGWLVILGLSLFNYLLRFMRWEFYLRRLGYAVPLTANIAIYLAGFGFTATPGKVGEAVRAVYLKRFSVTYVHGLAAFFVERLVDMLAIVVVASLAAYTFASTRWLVGITLLVTFASIPLIHSPAVLGWFEHRRQNLGPGRLRSVGEQLLNLVRASAALLRSGPLYAGFLLGLLAWFAEGYALYFVLDRLGMETPVLLAAGIYGVSVLAGAVSFVPGGLGGTELVMGSLLILTGVDAPIAVSSVIIIRLATLWFAVAIGLAFLLSIEFAWLGKPAGLPHDARTAKSGE